MEENEMTWQAVAKYALLIIIVTVCFVAVSLSLPLLMTALYHVADVRSAGIPCGGLLTR
jgi:hypothetical protein